MPTVLSILYFLEIETASAHDKWSASPSSEVATQPEKKKLIAVTQFNWTFSDAQTYLFTSVYLSAIEELENTLIKQTETTKLY